LNVPPIIKGKKENRVKVTFADICNTLVVSKYTVAPTIPAPPVPEDPIQKQNIKRARLKHHRSNLHAAIVVGSYSEDNARNYQTSK
jgi:hypothetical protein